MKKWRRSDDDFNAEIESHIALEADRIAEEEGLDRTLAVAKARRAFGNVTRAEERFYEASRFVWLDHLTRDIRYAFRQIVGTPVSAATIVTSLAIGIGVNIAIFSLADQALVRALPVDEPGRLVQLEWNGRFVGVGMGSVGYGHLIPHPLFRELREDNDVFVDLFARGAFEVHLAAAGHSEPIIAEVVSGSYFYTLGVKPALGRLLNDDDDTTPDAHPVVVLSYDYWQNRFAGDPDIVGRIVRMNDYPMTVIGIAEENFHGVDWGQVPEIWVPTMMKSRVTPDWNGLTDRRVRFLHVFGRLQDGVSREQAEASLEPRFKAYLRADTEREGWPQLSPSQMRDYMESSLELAPAARGVSFMRTYVEQPMVILLAATTLILLLACLNAANLSLARALARRRATALRTALGASRARIVGEGLVESGLLAFAGCVGGALLAPSVSRAIISFLPRQDATGVGLAPELDVRMMLFALALAGATTLIAGAGPALYAASVRPVTALKRERCRVMGVLGPRKALVVGQFVLALILLVGAGLFTRTLAELRSIGPGYPTSNLVTFQVNPVRDGRDVEHAKPLVRRLLAEIQALPDIEHAAASSFATLTGGGWNNPVTIDGEEKVVTDLIWMNAVTPDFFRVLDVALESGRAFDERDSHEDSGRALRSAIVNQEFVNRYLSDREPIGVRVGIGSRPDTGTEIEIVGVVTTFGNRSLREPEPQIFFSMWEREVRGGIFYVRARTSSESAARTIRDAVSRVDASLTVISLRTIDDQLDRLLTNERMLATLAVAFAVAATLLAMVGLYGVLSFSATRRTKEIGIRFALGASRWAAHGLVLREASFLAAVGIAIAFPVSWFLGRFVESQLFGVRSTDAVTFAASAAILVVVCLIAGVIAARKASAVSPLDALRTE